MTHCSTPRTIGLRPRAAWRSRRRSPDAPTAAIPVALADPAPSSSSSGTRTRSSTTRSDWVKLLEQVRHRGRRDGQADRLRHHRPDQQGPAGRASRATRPTCSSSTTRSSPPWPRRACSTTTDETKLDTSAIEPNLLAAGQLDGKTYGIPIGANTLALYYNKDVLTAAGVDIASVKDWASLTAALAKVKAAGKKGITFSAIGTEEGSFQFLPWFWGSGAQPHRARLGRGRLGADAVDRLAEEGLRAQLGHQQHPDHQLAGVRHRRLRVRRERHLAAGQRREGRLRVRHHPDPGAATAAPPRRRPAASSSPSRCRRTPPATPPRRRSSTCLTSADNLLTTDTTLSYIAPTDAVQDKQVAADAEAEGLGRRRSRRAKGRTSDNLGTKYPKISEPMWTAVQAALSGSKSPAGRAGTAAAGRRRRSSNTDHR